MGAISLSCTSSRYTYRALSLAESVGSNSTALRPTAYSMPARSAALNNSASCFRFFMHSSAGLGVAAEFADTAAPRPSLACAALLGCAQRRGSYHLRCSADAAQRPAASGHLQRRTSRRLLQNVVSSLYYSHAPVTSCVGQRRLLLSGHHTGLDLIVAPRHRSAPVTRSGVTHS